MSGIHRLLKDTLRIFAGSLLFAFGLQCFAVPKGLLLGGAGGAATVMYHLWRIPVGMGVALFNVPLLIFGYMVLGGRTLWRTAYATVWFTLAVSVGEQLFTYRWPGENISAAILGGLIMGLGLTLVYAGDYITGGTDLAAQILTVKLPRLSFGKWMLLMDSAIVLGGSALMGTLESGLYSVLMIFVYIRVFESYFSGRLLGKIMKRKV